MELGGNKNAAEYYETNGMYKDGKPDHEAAPHSRYKMELAQKVEAAIKAEMPQQQIPANAAPVASQPPLPESTSMTAGL